MRGGNEESGAMGPSGEMMKVNIQEKTLSGGNKVRSILDFIRNLGIILT